MKLLKITCHCAAIVLALSSLRAEVVAEWKFDTDKELAGGEIVKLDVVAPGASDVSKLMDLSTVKPLETGLGEKWQSFLQKGYLDAPKAVGAGVKNQSGLKTENTSAENRNGTYRSYLGFAGLGKADKGLGGTVYLVVKPNEAWESPAKRRVLFGTGHTIEGSIKLIVNEDHSLALVAAGVRDRDETAKAVLEYAWERDKWYFVAASWQEGSMPVLFVRGMSADGGPQASPEGMIGQADRVAPSSTDAPKQDPLVVGGFWFNSGGEWFVIDGADAQIAYARVENTYSTVEEMKAVFATLGSL